MAIKPNIKMYSVSWLAKQNQDGKLNKNISIQRKEIWDNLKKSNLIVSLLISVPIESLLFEDADKKSYNILDGKQRTLTLCAFVDDGFALSPKIRLKELDGVQLVGMKFSDLPDEMKSKILDYQLSISVLDPMCAEDRAMVFFMRNQSVPLSKMDLTPVVLGEGPMNALEALCAHPFMTERVKLTAPAIRKRDDLKLLLQYMILRSGNDSGFSGTEIMTICDDIKNGEVETHADEITAVMDYLNEAIPSDQPKMKKIQIPMVLYVAQLAKGKKMKVADFGERLKQFFENQTPDSEYMALCQSGSARKTNVQRRVEIIRSILD